MNAYFFNITKEERENILDKHKEVYDGYVTQYVKPEVQELYVQDLANDKKGITLNNKGEVGVYRNMNINEMKHDGKDTGLFSNESEIDEQLDMIGDGPTDLENGTVDIDYENEDFLEDYEDGWEGNPFDYMKDGGFFDDVDLDDEDFIEIDVDDPIEQTSIILNVSESLDMFRRFTKYN
jgi:hypothetical protein